MKLIVGLGNPGRRYEHTLHNVGFDVLSVLSQKLNIPIKKKLAKALVGEGSYGGERLVLAAPQTFMNLSGESVVPLMQWYKVQPEGLLVIYDDTDLPLGKLRIRTGGSAGTHNGMKSIIGQLGSQQFPRIRVGIGKAPEGWDLADYVLSHYPDAETRKEQFEAFLRAADAALCWCEKGIEDAMRLYNG